MNPLGPYDTIKFRHIFFVWLWASAWFVIAWMESWPARIDLMTYYGWYPAALLVVATALVAHLANGTVVAKMLTGVGLLGGYFIGGFLYNVANAGYENVFAGIWHDLVDVGPGGTCRALALRLAVY